MIFWRISGWRIGLPVSSKRPTTPVLLSCWKIASSTASRWYGWTAPGSRLSQKPRALRIAERFQREAAQHLAAELGVAEFRLAGCVGNQRQHLARLMAVVECLGGEQIAEQVGLRLEVALLRFEVLARQPGAAATPFLVILLVAGAQAHEIGDREEGRIGDAGSIARGKGSGGRPLPSS